MKKDLLSRRTVLAGLGVTGAAAVTGLTVLTEPVQAFEHSMQLRSSPYACEINWVETYNGTTLEDTTDSSIGSDTGPIVSLSDVVPGDSGSVVIGVRNATDDDDSGESFAVRFDVNVTEMAENGRTEPELKDNDESPNEGELQEFIDVEIWYDTGLPVLGGLGDQNGVQDVGEQEIDPDASGSLVSVADALSEANDDGVLLGPSTGRCLGPDDEIVLALDWEFRDGPDVNVAQTDSVTFDLAFSPEACTQ